jgi:hypothetical protein
VREAEGVTGPAGVPVPVPVEEEEEDRESLEVEGDVVSLEVPERSYDRVVVDQDDQGEAIVRRRIEAAEARNRPSTLADHRRFDQMVRAPGPEPVPVRKARRASMREAFVWREVLGKPGGRTED